MRDVLVVGSLNVDISRRTARIPRPGETVQAGDLRIVAGGKGLNQALAAARLGARVHMIGRVGGDGFADIPRAIEDTVSADRHVADPSLEEVLEADRRARDFTEDWVRAKA